MTVGARIRSCRRRLGWTQRKLAVELCKVGCSAAPHDIMRWETDRNIPRLDAARGLAEVLGVSLDWLIRSIEPVCVVAVADDGHSEC